MTNLNFKTLTDEDFEALADEAERGYDIGPLLKKQRNLRCRLGIHKWVTRLTTPRFSTGAPGRTYCQRCGRVRHD